MSELLLQSAVASFPCRSGKVRDVYDLGDQLIIVATDRISAFDWVLPTGIPDKGRVLTALTLFWLERLPTPHHLIDTQIESWPEPFAARKADLAGRSMRVRKTGVVPIECVVRGYLAGSAWSEYSKTGSTCGISLPQGLVESQQLSEPLFTPATKEESGHDVNISWTEFVQRVGPALAEDLRERSLRCYSQAAAYARDRGILIADTKFEWGKTPAGELILVDEVLTPDSSRFWPAAEWQSGKTPPSFDKQFVRDWLLTSGWDRNSPPPALPEEVVERTRQKYVEAYTRLTGRSLPST
ncbi:MAG TPA: phosphoribosylaminoimidazolesuccinocarboxamide synthase [Gemmataceae bacterium]|jgi:phosphoribosylaminoimidazole-succinocarboxamide synthase|nr:phosphoribosylaminoimidazolesuccinocarboxamide synthase [Gemmataceae bacterium]